MSNCLTVYLSNFLPVYLSNCQTEVHPQDPYEARLVSVRRSKMAGGGEGVFARRDLPAGTLAAFFNGHKVNWPALFISRD